MVRYRYSKERGKEHDKVRINRRASKGVKEYY